MNRIKVLMEKQGSLVLHTGIVGFLSSAVFGTMLATEGMWLGALVCVGTMFASHWLVDFGADAEGLG